VDEAVKGLDPAFGLRAAEDPRRSATAAPDVERCEVGERAPALVGVLDSQPTGARRSAERLVHARAGLDRGLLIGADDEVAGVKSLSLPASLVEVEHGAGLLEEGRVGGEDPGAVLPGAQRVLGKPARDRRCRGLGEAALDDETMKLGAANNAPLGLAGTSP